MANFEYIRQKQFLINNTSFGKREWTEFEYVQTTTTTETTETAMVAITMPAGGVDRIVALAIPRIICDSDEDLANKILTYLTEVRGFNLENINECVYTEDGIISAVAVQYGYYDEYAGIAIE